MATSTMKLKLHVWRQESPAARGGFVTYEADANEHMSFLEMLDVLNESLESRGGWCVTKYAFFFYKNINIYLITIIKI